VVEADGVNIALQSVYSGIMNGDRFWEGVSLSLAKKYDLSQISKVIVGGDGASWVKQGAELLGGLYELDRFHLKRALHQGFALEGSSPKGLADNPLVVEVYESCTRGEISKVDRLLIEAQEKAMLKGDQYQDRDNAAWLSAGLPALCMARIPIALGFEYYGHWLMGIWRRS